jgi:hypothetical protein
VSVDEAPVHRTYGNEASMTQREISERFGFMDDWEVDLNESIWGVANGKYNEPPLSRKQSGVSADLPAWDAPGQTSVSKGEKQCNRTDQAQFPWALISNRVM